MEYWTDKLINNIINILIKRREKVFGYIIISKKNILETLEWTMFFLYWISFIFINYFFIDGQYIKTFITIGCTVIFACLYFLFQRLNK